MTAYWVTGHTLDVLRAMPDDSVDLVLTSPPFLALRSYLPADDPNKPMEIGSEATPGEFLDVLLDVTEELRRVLAPHGSIAIELGDTYSGSGGRGGDYLEGGMREGQPGFDGSAARKRAAATERQAELLATHVDRSTDEKYQGQRLQDRRRSATNGNKNRDNAPGWPMDKSLCLVPELYRFALAYGFNPLTGRTTPRWRVRNVVRWVRPNPPVGALGDKFRPATSDMVIATVARDRYFDLDAVRGPGSPNTHARTAKGVKVRPNTTKSGDDDRTGGNRSSLAITDGEPGAPPLDWWEVPTHPYKGSHYATWPPALLERPIKAMCPQRVCQVCGQPSRRIVDVQGLRGKDFLGIDAGNVRDVGLQGKRPPMPDITRTTVGWTDCGHNAWRPGRVLDPFGGSGTTLAVATGHGRDAIGIDLDARNVDLARERVGMWLTEVTAAELAAALGGPTEAAA